MAKAMAFQGSSMEWQLNIYKIIERGIRYFPKQEIVFQTYDKGVQRYTYADLYKRACSMANALKKLGLKPGGRIREVLLSIEPVKIVAARFHAGNHGGEVTPFPSLKGHNIFSGGDEMHLYPLRQWRR